MNPNNTNTFLNKDLIVNYLTVKISSDKTFDVHYAKRIRAAWILAEKQYLKLTEKEKQKILDTLAQK